MSPPLGRRVDAGLHVDPARVVARLFLPGEQLPGEQVPGEQVPVEQSRTSKIVARIMLLPEPEVEALAAGLVSDFGTRHRHYEDLLIHHASIVCAHAGEQPTLSRSRRLVLGASFTAEYAVEGAALCNPSAVLHPDQGELAEGQVRVAISLRGIGEGHLSSIGFCSAIVGPGVQWSFEPRQLPACAGVARPGLVWRAHLGAALAEQGHVDDLGAAVLLALPTQLGGIDLERVLAALPADLLLRPGAPATAELLRRLVSSAYVVEFPAEVSLDKRVLLPSAAEESNGMEDARFTRFVDDDGTVEYRATYTAYDGQRIAPRLLLSSDLRVFRAHRLTGPAARNKGMALFPRTVHGRHLALCRSDGESTGLTSSDDGHIWGEPVELQHPRASWELLQVGNCGPPIETEHGWLVLTHGVGPMRSYAMGAILLDRDDPSRVIGWLDRPFLEPAATERNGYVPNVVYSCGGFVQDGVLWLPFGIDDVRIGVAWAPVEEVIARMSDVGELGGATQALRASTSA